MGVQPPTDMERLHDIIRNLQRDNRHLKAEVQQLKCMCPLSNIRPGKFKSDYCGVNTA